MTNKFANPVANVINSWVCNAEINRYDWLEIAMALGIANQIALFQCTSPKSCV